MDLNYYNVFSDAGYNVVSNNTELQAASNSDRLLGIFSISNMAKWFVESCKWSMTPTDDFSGWIETCTPTISKETKTIRPAMVAMPLISQA